MVLMALLTTAAGLQSALLMLPLSLLLSLTLLAGAGRLLGASQTAAPGAG